MENATKALEMAGSVLIGVLLLGCLLFAYTRMSELKDTNQDYEAYNRKNLYGTDLFSLANKIEDYNKESIASRGDNKETISLLVTIKTEIIDGKFFTSKTYSVEELNKSYKQLANAINSINKEFHGKTISYWANFGTGNGLDEQLKKELRTDNI